MTETGRGAPFLWLCGPSGVGKSTTGFALYDELTRAGVPVAFADADQLGLALPEPGPGGHRVKAPGLAAVWEVFQAAGARCLLLSGFADDVATVRRYADAMPGTELTLCRLRASPAELARRYTGRGWLPDALPAVVRGAAELDRAGLPGVVVDTDGLPFADVAARVRAAAGGWPGPLPAGPAPGAGVPAAPPGGGRVLWVCGPPGVGKSTVAWEVFTGVAAGGVPAAYVDLAQVSFCPGGGPGSPVAFAALAALWAVHRAAGARCLVVCGTSGDAAALAAGAAALRGAELTVCRLRAGRAALTERVLLRGRGGGPPLPGDALRGRPEAWLREVAGRGARESAALDRAGLPGVVVDTDGRTPAEVAALVRARTGFPTPA